eukprot:Hpha_TRINITY_DN15330_c2_g4::TRINITY_DN15330_c2_g4_i2::g.88716::m.88716/K06210/NMNAT; nicotinamide mononucleotide adenylyltransferase
MLPNRSVCCRPKRDTEGRTSLPAVPTRSSSIKRQNAKRQSQAGEGAVPKEAVVVLGGSFAPLHAGHLAALEAGKRAAEKAGYVVTAGYLAVAHDFHLRGKLRRRGEDVEEFGLGADARLRMCNATAEASTWLQPTPSIFKCAWECGMAMVTGRHTRGTRVWEVKGSQLRGGLHRVGRQELSSTYVRRAIREGGAAAAHRLVAEGVLPPPVAAQLLGARREAAAVDRVHEAAEETAEETEAARKEAPHAVAP